jgi:hypothetical protein
VFSYNWLLTGGLIALAAIVSVASTSSNSTRTLKFTPSPLPLLPITGTLVGAAFPLGKLTGAAGIAPLVCVGGGHECGFCAGFAGCVAGTGWRLAVCLWARLWPPYPMLVWAGLGVGSLTMGEQYGLLTWLGAVVVMVAVGVAMTTLIQRTA